MSQAFTKSMARNIFFGGTVFFLGGEFIKAWMQAMPTNVPGRRQMPQFNLTPQERDDMVAFPKITLG